MRVIVALAIETSSRKFSMLALGFLLLASGFPLLANGRSRLAELRLDRAVVFKNTFFCLSKVVQNHVNIESPFGCCAIIVRALFSKD